MLPPCKDCPDRAPGCHGKCEKYKAFAEWNAENREKRHLGGIAPEGWKKVVQDMMRKRRR